MFCNEEVYNSIYGRLKRILSGCLDSDYYRGSLGLTEEKINNGISYEEFQKIPFLTKNEYRNHLFEIVNKKFGLDKEEYHSFGEDFNKKKEYLLSKGLYVKVTSGSTGIPLEVIKSVRDIKKDYFSLNLIRRKRTGTLPQGNFLWLWPTNEFTRRYFYTDNAEYYKVNDYGFQFMISEYSDEVFANLFNFIEEKEIRWVTASPSMLVNFADYMERKGIAPYSFSYVECHSEYLYDWQKEMITKYFGTEPVSIYSSNEIQFMGCSCSKGHMHIITQDAFVEILENEEHRNEVVVTSLNNEDIPLVRYRIGDCAEWGEPHECELSGYPCIELKQYRSNDYLISENGKKFEPFVVCDAIVFIKAKFTVQVNKYLVYQNAPNSLICFIDAPESFWKEQNNILEFLKYYFHEVTGCCYDISILEYNESYGYLNTAKYKYFINGVKNEQSARTNT